MTVLRLAVAVDAPPAWGYVGMLLDALERTRDIQLTTLLLPAAPGGRGGRGGRYRREQVAPLLVRRLAALLLLLETRALRTSARITGRLARRTSSLRAGHADLRSRFGQVLELSDGDTCALETKPDVVLVLGPWLPSKLPAALAECAPHAQLIQLALGDFAAQGLALAGFEESNAGADQTAIRLYRIGWVGGLGERDRSRRLLIDGRNRTRPLFSLNQAACWHRAAALLQQHLVPGNAVAPAAPEEPGAGGPDLRLGARVLAYPARMFLRGLRLAVKQASGKRRWGVAIYRPGPSWNTSGAPMAIESAPAGGYYADPMLYRDPATQVAYCLVEEFDGATGRGHITVLQEQADGWKRLGIALKEPFHLSFPFLFEYGGERYLCPESGASGEIAVYRCLEFPLRWERCAVLMRNVSATDTMIFPHAGRWWMLTNLDLADCPDHQSELHLFHATSPLSSDWQRVPGNPVKFDCRGARNGGLKIVGGRIFRFGQVQSFEAYGHRLNVYEVTRLDTGGYEEKLVQEIAPPAGSQAVGIHTWSSIDGLVAVDLLGAS